MTHHHQDDAADGAFPPFRLDDRGRAELCPGLDVEALEGLMSMLPAEVRPHVLRFFLDWSDTDPEEVLAAFPEIEPEGPPGGRTFLLPQPEQLYFDMPALQAQLERVLAGRTLWWSRDDATPEG